jgi:hypothetical protein
LELNSKGTYHTVKIAALTFGLEVIDGPFLTPLSVAINLTVKNNAYHSYGKHNHHEPRAFLALMGSRPVELDKLLDGRRYRVNYPINYILSYNKEKNCIDIEVHDKQKTVITAFDLRLIQRQNQKAKEMINQKSSHEKLKTLKEK